MSATFAIRAHSILGAAVLVLLGGCQTFNGMLAGFKPAAATPNSSAIASDTTPAKPITKEQKIAVLMAMARAEENNGNVEHAIEVYEDVIKKDSGHVEAYHRLAIVYDSKGDRQKAREYFMTAIQKAPKNAELYCDFGYSCYLQRNWAEAGDNLRRALDLRPEFARAHTNLGLLLARTYHESEALAEFSKAGCDEAAARSNLAFALTVEDRWQEARQQYELALQADPNFPAAKKGLAALAAHAPGGDVAGTPPPAAVARPPLASIVPPPSIAAPPPVVLQSHAPADDLARMPAPPSVVPPPVASIAPPPVMLQTQSPAGDVARLPPPPSIAPPPVASFTPPPVASFTPPPVASIAPSPPVAAIAPPPAVLQTETAEAELAPMPVPTGLTPSPTVQTSSLSTDVRRY